MNEIKVRLSMEVPGATMLSTQDCVKMSKKEAYDHSTVTVEYKVKKGKKTKIERDILHINTRKSRHVKHNLSINKEAFSYMTDARNFPSPKLKKAWEQMSIRKRLEYHLNLIAEYFNAYSFTYEILED